jgi:hypothetical protein
MRVLPCRKVQGKSRTKAGVAVCHVGEAWQCSAVNKVWLSGQDFVGQLRSAAEIFAESVDDFADDCLTCPVGKAAIVQCANGTKLLDKIAERDCSGLKTKADCREKDDKDQCCVCGGGVRDYNPAAQTSCEMCATVFCSFIVARA